MAIARMRRACLASAIRAASARNCEILRSWRVISIADMLPRSPNQQQDESSHVCGCLGIPQESDSRALGMTTIERRNAALEEESLRPKWVHDRFGLCVSLPGGPCENLWSHLPGT